MTQFFAWLARTVLLPLLPAIVGTVMRSVYSDEWILASIDSGELAFSVALIGVIALSSVNRLTDKALRDALSPVFVLILAVALCLFAGSLLMKVFHDREQLELLTRLKASNPVDSTLLAVIGSPDRCTRVLDQIRTWTLISGGLTVLLVVVVRVRYSIQDDGAAATV